MNTILCIGAGRSTRALISYLCQFNKADEFRLIIADKNLQMAQEKITLGGKAEAVALDIFEEEALDQLVGEASLVISMVPANLHHRVLESCIRQRKDFVSASYVTEELMQYQEAIEEAGILVMKECGLDPGIDHMSAMQELDAIRNKGGRVNTFETFTGGLLAPSKVENPWEYKFTWNPRNVVLAGQGVVKFLQEGRYKYIPYNKLFNRTEIIYIPQYGYFEGYANRDSLKYREVYGLQDIQTLYRGTLRRVGYCKAWNVFVQIGATDDSYQMEGVAHMSHRQFINSFLSYNPDDSVELKLAHYLNIGLDSDIMYKLKWLGLFEDALVGLEKGSPAQILEHILRKKWTLNTEEKDMVVMWHRFVYELEGKLSEYHTHMVVKGKNANETAMADTVGLPLGIVAINVLNGKIKTKGIQRPISAEVYEPVLRALKGYGITFEKSLIH
ncbi:saccharopine dehydrogenase family protein [Persicobacter diffluens]|uniref:Saccharopine dehydrogenase n=1 Tax=Persicobacter diffluens TaxID=981 RepID=A0AAN5AKY4_9BACT|nr:saccharopine dehydrogenase [Persicobacter diffluens]